MGHASYKDIGDKEKISKVAEYVEHAFSCADVNKTLRRRYYIVLETEMGNKIVTERLSEGQLSWIGNSDTLEDRNSLARLTRSDSCSSGVTVRDMMNFRAKIAEGAAPSSKQFSQVMFSRVVGSKGKLSPLNRDLSVILPNGFSK